MKLPYLFYAAKVMTLRFLLAVFFVSVCMYCGSEASLDQESAMAKEDCMFLQKATQALYGLSPSDLSVDPLGGGFSGDHLYHLKSSSQEAVLRVHAEHKGLDDRKAECLAAKIASDLGIGPQLLYEDGDNTCFATAYAEGSPASHLVFKDSEAIRALAQSLKRLHSVCVFPREWSVFAYIRNIKIHDLSAKQTLALSYLESIEAVLNNANFPKHLCHNDIQPNNLFVFNNNLQMIDWGDAGMADPFWDLARSSMEFAFEPSQDKALLESYLGVVKPLDQSHFCVMKQVFLLRSAFALQGLEGEPDTSSQALILKILKNNDYPPLDPSTIATWKALSAYLLDLFLNNYESIGFQETLKSIPGAAL